MLQCPFSREYPVNKFDTEPRKSYKCDEEAQDKDTLCIFHDDTYLIHSENHTGVRRRLMEKIEQKIKKNEPLRFIGYHLPSVQLVDMQFTAPVYFSECVFYGHLVIRKVSFNRCDFSNTEFKKELNIQHSTFSKETSFFRSNIRKAYFSFVYFHDTADFNETQFRELEFYDLSFKNKALFQFAQLNKGYFRGVIDFHMAADFRRAEFYEIEFGPKTKFYDGLDFLDCVFHGRTNIDIQNFGYYARFCDVSFEDQDKTRFTAEKLSRVSFINTDISRMRFQESVIWGDGEHDRFKIFDEKLIERSLNPLFRWTDLIKNTKEQKKLRDYLVNELGQEWVNNECSIKNIEKDTVALVSDNPKSPHILEMKRGYYNTVTLRLDNERLLPIFVTKGYEDSLWVYSSGGVRVETVKAIYRNLRENYEYRMRYNEAGQLFVREMELKRKYKEVRTHDVYPSPYQVKENGPLRRNLSLTGIYHNLFNYGESLKRPALTLLLPLFVISVFYFLVRSPPSSLDLNGLIHTVNIIGRTALDMFQVEMEKPELADNIIRTLSLSIFAALFIPLRRKFERRFRH